MKRFFEEAGTMPHLRRLGTVSGIALAAALAATGAEAQSSPAAAAADGKVADAPAGGGADIVVTAQRRSESIQSVPIAITAVSAQTIQKSNIRGLEGYLAQTPNVSFVTNGSRDRKDISIRGISNQLDPYSDSRPAAFAFYIDDFSVIAGTSNPQIADLERVEILRGPQGTYFGRNSVGGAINISTKKPVQAFQAEAQIGYSSFNTKQGELVLNVPLVRDLLAVRAVGQIESSDGNIKNINPIGGGNNTNYKTGRIIARLTPAVGLTNDLSFSYSRERNGMRAGVPTGFLTATWRNVYYGGRAGDVADPDGVGFYPTNTNRVNFNRPQSVGTDFWYISDRASYDFGPATLTAVGGYIRSKVFNFGDVDGGSRDYFYENNTLRHNSLSGELRLASNGKHFLDWTVGINAGSDKGSTEQSTRYGTAGLLGRPEGFEISGISSNGSNKYIAGFGQLTMNISSHLIATAGLRYSHEVVSEYYIRRSNNSQTDLVNQSKPFNDFSPRFNLSYKVDSNLLFYVTISKGFKSGGVQTASQVPGTFFEPEKLWNYEAGTKFSAFDHRLRADVSVFYNNWSNVQQQTRFIFFNAAGALISVNGVSNAAKARSYGIDGSFDFRLTPELTVSGHGGYLNAKYRSYTNALVDGLLLDATGKPLINAPKWTAGGNIEYRRTIFSDFDGFIRPEWTYRSEKLNSVYGLRYYQYPFISPGYNSFNLRLGLENKAYTLTLYAENIFKKNYFENAYEKAFYSGVQVEPSVRRFGATLRVRYK